MSDLQQKTNKGPIKLQSIHSSGKCIAVNEGKNIFFESGIPGEEVTYTSNRNKHGYRTGTITRIISKSKSRISPFCIHDKECGGCPWQHIEYEHQLKLKHQVLLDALEKYQVETPDVPKVIPSPQLHFYRHRVEYSFSAPQILGFHNTVDPAITSHIQECFLQPQISRKIWDYIQTYSIGNNLEYYDSKNRNGFLRSLSIRVNKHGQVLIVIGLNKDNPELRENLLNSLVEEFNETVSVNYTVHLSPDHSQMQGEIIPAPGNEPYIYETLNNLTFRVHASSFFQPNVAQAENIFRTIQDWAGLKGSEKVIDLYTGVGTIPHFLSSAAGQITGIEGSPKAVEDARANMLINNLNNMDFIQGDILKTFTLDFVAKNGKPDVITLDPPRSGTLIEIKKTINSSGALKVIYLSCNPVSLAFDLKQLTEVYNVTHIQPFDMLPHTHHLETLVMLERK